MECEIIPLPTLCGDTTCVDGPWIQIMGKHDETVTLKIRLATGTSPDGHDLFVELNFTDVFEYRWIYAEAEYWEFGLSEIPPYPGLMEIKGSPYIENMLSKGTYSARKGQRVGSGMDENAIHHFIFMFSEYGVFHILALGLSIKQIPD